MESHPEIIDRKRQGQPFLAAEEERLRWVEAGKGEEKKRKKENKKRRIGGVVSSRAKDFVLVIREKVVDRRANHGR